MKKIQYIFVLLAVMALASCSDDTPQSANQNADLTWCVRAAWHDGLASGGTTRAFTATNLFAPGGSDIDIAFDDYPDNINVECNKKNGEHFSYITLTKGTQECDNDKDKGYYQYTPSIIYKVMKVKRDNLQFYATFTLDDGDKLITAHSDDPLVTPNAFGYSDIRDTHMRLTFRHTKALLRFAFKVDGKYDRIRNIKVTGIQLNGNNLKITDRVLESENYQVVGYMYVNLNDAKNPTYLDMKTSNTVICTYDIYDEDVDKALLTQPYAGLTDAQKSELDEHRTRTQIQAQNTFTLNNVFYGSPSTQVNKLLPGYYYDLNVTLNPDYLYVLSEHDNKHMTIQ